jgi:hypothetical protein
MSETQKETLYNAAKVIDDLLDKDDGEFLASLARYKFNLIELFGRENLTILLKECISEAPYINYYSKRSEREINPNRPSVTLKVDEISAVKENSQLNQNAKDLLDLKAIIVNRYVCAPLIAKLNVFLEPHWAKSKQFINANFDPSVDINLLLCTMFRLSMEDDLSIKTVDRMCTLSMIL